MPMQCPDAPGSQPHQIPKSIPRDVSAASKSSTRCFASLARASASSLDTVRRTGSPSNIKGNLEGCKHAVSYSSRAFPSIVCASSSFVPFEWALNISPRSCHFRSVSKRCRATSAGNECRSQSAMMNLRLSSQDLSAARRRFSSSSFSKGRTWSCSLRRTKSECTTSKNLLSGHVSGHLSEGV